MVVDEIRVGNWQRSNEGAPKGKQTPRPKPFPRPGVGGRAKRADKSGPERQEARQRALRRAAERKRALASGEIT